MIDMPPALPDGFVCPEGTVPGWLNGDGLPTSCVGDLPMVDPPQVFLEPLPTPIEWPSASDVLAVTGPADDLVSWLIVVASALILGGLVVAGLRQFGDHS